MSQFPLSLHDDRHGGATPWAVTPPEPTNLITLWRGHQQPTADQIIESLKKTHGGAIESIQEVSPPDEQMQWVRIIQLADWPTPIIVWIEPLRALSPDELKSLDAQSIKWTIGAEMVLGGDDPLADFVKLLRLFGRAFSDSPAILDVNKETWHTRDQLEQDLLCEDIEPTESLLWSTHVAGNQSTPAMDSKVWIYTSGLNRCGLPELEMLEVPISEMEPALMLLSSVGELIVEGGMPPPGQPMEVGVDLAVTLQPWREVAPYVNIGNPGGMERLDHNGQPADGVRAVICATEPVGSYRKVWVWPEKVVHQIRATGLTAIFKTIRATRRRTKMAQSTWDDLASAFATMPAGIDHDNDDREIVFLIKAEFRAKRSKLNSKDKPEGDIDLLIADRTHEDLWFEVKNFKAGKAEAILVNDPYRVSDLRKGDVAQIDRGTITDWQVLTRQQSFDAGKVRELRAAIQQLRKGAV